MITILKSEAPPADKAGSAMIYLLNNSDAKWSSPHVFTPFPC